MFGLGSKYLMSRYKKSVRQQGFGYSYGGKNSLDSEETRAISSWERLRAGTSIISARGKEHDTIFSRTHQG